MSAILRFLGVVALIWLALVALMWLFQRRLIYLPDTGTPTAPPQVEVIRATTADGVEHALWLVPAQGEAIARAVVFNGNAGHKQHRLALAADLSEQGFEVLLFDYRGYGDTSGRPSETGILVDGRTVVEVAHDTELLVVYVGESLGAAVATRLAIERPPAGLVLRSPFPSLADVARHHYRIIPAGLLLRDRWQVEAIIGQVEAPVLVILGTADTIIPPRLSRRVYEAAAEPRELVAFAGLDHNDPGLTSGPELAREIRRFVTELPESANGR